ncbi:MAG: bifunctional chorismate mutase/prephenate dehydrogenase [Methanobacteriota archaeon]|nr:MAG: bifunctional chorismate mutase/prephenate dehydrogenase [Euryarchaeota archaeon]
MTQAEIEGLRLDIGAVDDEILRLVARRMEMAREVGRTKRKCGADIRDQIQEERVFGAAAERAAELGLAEDTALRIVRVLIEGAVEVQEGTADDPLSGSAALVVGSGRMGAWTSRFLSNRGANVSVFDTKGALDGYANVEALDGAASEADLTVVASPLGTASEDLERVFSARPSGIVFDVCSVKSHIKQLLVDAAGEGLKVTSVHPMFGPSSPTPKGENVLVCSCGSHEADRVAKELFGSAGANVSEVPLERHDQLIATVLGLPHLVSMLFGKATISSESPCERLRGLQGPSFRRLSGLARDTALESRRVYHDIQRLNPSTRATLDLMSTALEELRSAALSDDPAEFRSMMDEQKRYFGGGRQ